MHNPPADPGKAQARADRVAHRAAAGITKPPVRQHRRQARGLMVEGLTKTITDSLTPGREMRKGGSESGDIQRD
jgi:hypothetical protein